MRSFTSPSTRVVCAVGDIATLPQTEIHIQDVDGAASGFQVSKTTRQAPQAPQTMTISRCPDPLPIVMSDRRPNSSLQWYMRHRLEDTDRSSEHYPTVPVALRPPKRQTVPIPELSVEIQIGFRRMVLSVFALQLLLLTGLMALLTYESTLENLLKDTVDGQPLLLMVPLGVLLAVLELLFLVRAKFPLNWIIVLLFSAVLSVFLAGFQAWFEAKVALYCCGFTFVNVCVMVPLSGVKRLVGPSESVETVLRSSLFAGIIGFAVTAGLAGVLFGAFGQDSVTPKTFGYALLFEFALITCFSVDANSMYSVLTPVEYMNGVVYFYMDLLALVALTIFVGCFIIACMTVLPLYKSLCGNCSWRSNIARIADRIQRPEAPPGGRAVVVPWSDGSGQR